MTAPATRARERAARLALSALSGALLALSVPPAGLWPLMWIALAPQLHVALTSRTPRRAFLHGWLTGTIANTAGFHFAFIEQGGSSLYPQLAQRVSNVEVLRILLSIGPVETSHFQTWHDKAGNVTPLDAVDPVTKVKVSFRDLTNPKLGENLIANLIMPDPTAFLSRNLPVCSIIRPTATANAAMNAVKSLTDDGLFIGQSSDFTNFITELATQADAAARGF